MRKPIIDKNKSYNFSDYFNLNLPTEQVVAEFDYKFSIENLELPKASLDNIPLSSLKAEYARKMQFVSLQNETARREFFISPLFFRLLDYVETRIEIEYNLDFNSLLKGKIDYFLHAQRNFVVVEAKFADMENGFTQLAVEMIAVDKYYEDEKSQFVYGAVTVGDIWRFGALDRANKIIFRDIGAYTIPTNLEELFAILLGILQNKE